MEYVFNDGGREAAGYKGKTGDCVCRAIAIVSGRPYQEVYDALADGSANQRKSKRSKVKGRSARNGIYTSRKWFKDYMTSLGFSWVPMMGIGTGCKVHLSKDELPAGKIIARVSRHYTAILDGVIHDTYDCSRDEKRCVYGYWKM